MYINIQKCISQLSNCLLGVGRKWVMRMSCENEQLIKKIGRSESYFSFQYVYLQQTFPEKLRGKLINLSY